MSHQDIHIHIIDNIDEGIVTIGLDGTILDFNPAAERILHIQRKEVLGEPFGACFLLDERNDAFAQAVIESIYDANTTHNNVIHYHHNDGHSALALSTSYLQNDEGEKQGVIAVFRDITEIEDLRKAEEVLNQELSDKNHKLAASYLEIEESNLQLQAALKKVKVVRTTIFFFALSLLIGLAAYNWNPDPDDYALASVASLNGDLEEGSYQLVTLNQEAFTSALKLTGFIKPLEIINVVSPMSGHVAARHFEYGERVKKGDILFSINTDETSVKYRDAQATYISALEDVEKLENWQSSLEVARSRRSLSRIKLRLESDKQKADESKRLFELGIISQNEYKNTQQQLLNTRLEYASALEDLNNTQSQGGKQKQTVARLKLENAKYRMNQLKYKLEQSEIKAPVSGVVLLPKIEQGKRELLETGSNLSEGAIALSIGNLEGLSVQVEVGEMEIGKISAGQSVQVSGDAFPELILNGRVAQVSSQANDTNGHSVPKFSILVTIPHLSASQQQQIRVGMSANLDVEIYKNETALMAPIDAVFNDMNGVYVRIKDQDGVRKVYVKTGLTTLTQVEILDGLEPGSELVIASMQEGAQ